MTTGSPTRFPAIASAWQGLVQAVLTDAERYRHIRDYSKLDTLSDELLRDMGLTRDQVRRARAETERAAFWKLW